MQKNTWSAQNTQIFSTQIQKYYQHQLNTPVRPLPRLVTILISRCIDRFCLTLHIEGIIYDVGLWVWVPSFSTVCELELYHYSFILFAFPYSVVKTLKFIYCARALRYVFCCLTLQMFLPMSFGGRMCVWWVHTSISARFGPKGPHAKLKVPAFLSGYQLAHRQCRLPAACILAKTWLFMLFILTISVDV